MEKDFQLSPDATTASRTVASGPYANATAELRLAMLHPQAFDVSTLWNGYQVQFNIIADANSWGFLTHARVLAAQLRSTAVEVLECLAPENFPPHDVSLAAFKSCFGDLQVPQLHYEELLAHRQRFGETMAELCAEVEQLAHRSCRELLWISYLSWEFVPF